VLIVEDEHSIGSLIRSYLSRDGYGVVWVRSGEEALVELARHSVRIVVLDIGLPGWTASRSAAPSAAARPSRS
jgi:DNA-binding response OmpR family regulator